MYNVFRNYMFIFNVELNVRIFFWIWLYIILVFILGFIILMVDMVLNKLKLCVKRFKLLKLAFKFNIYYNLR